MTGYDEFVEETYQRAEDGEINWDEADEEIRSFEQEHAGIRSLSGALDQLYKEMEEIRKSMRTADDLYLNTAGEIEARDVQRRQALSGEERNKKAPNLGDENTVFADRSGTSYDILRTLDNKPFVEIKTDVLAGVPQADWKKTVQNNLRNKFPNGIVIGKNQIVIDKQSRKELTWSKYTEWLKKNDPQAYGDKLRATDYADEILDATLGWINEGLNHQRKDNIVDFARGKALIRIGNNGYIVDVVVGYEKNGTMKLYDLLDLTPTTIIEKETGTVYARDPSPGSSRKPATLSSNNNVPQSAEESKQNISAEDLKERQLYSVDVDEDQVTFDDITGGEMERSNWDPVFREKYETAAEVTADVKEYFAKLDENDPNWLSGEDIDGMLNYDPFAPGWPDSTMDEPGYVAELLLDRAMEQTGAERQESYLLAERLLPYMDALTRQTYIGDGAEMDVSARHSNAGTTSGIRAFTIRDTNREISSTGARETSGPHRTTRTGKRRTGTENWRRSSGTRPQRKTPKLRQRKAPKLTQKEVDENLDTRQDRADAADSDLLSSGLKLGAAEGADLLKEP